MKKAAIEIDREVRRRKLDVLKTGDIHDEFQFDCLARHSQELGHDVCPLSFGAAGRFFDYRVGIECEPKFGLTWAETH